MFFSGVASSVAPEMNAKPTIRDIDIGCYSGAHKNVLQTAQR